ncbi:MAG: hypothetical protein AB1817_09850 [Chloroflexota bacterium]
MVATFFDQKTTLAPMRQSLSIQELAESLRDNAVAQARQKFSILGEDDLQTLFDMPAFLNAFKHALGCGVAQVLAENDPAVQQVYTYDPSTNPDCESGDDLPMSATIHLLVRVSQPSAALEALIASLDQALTAKLAQLPSAEFAQRTCFLDINLLSDEDAQRGAGYAALLTSLFAPPLRIW